MYSMHENMRKGKEEDLGSSGKLKQKYASKKDTWKSKTKSGEAVKRNLRINNYKKIKKSQIIAKLKNFLKVAKHQHKSNKLLFFFFTDSTD